MIHYKIDYLFIEGDNLTIINVLQDNWHTLWKLQLLIEDIRCLFFHQFKDVDSAHFIEKQYGRVTFLLRSVTQWIWNKA